MGIKKITQIGLTEQERRMTIDLTPFMNINPLSVQARLCDSCVLFYARFLTLRMSAHGCGE
jgi:hypothetical protein